MEYNIGFVIGDPSGDGHACTTEYHIRVCGRLIRYGAVYTIGRNSKWTRRAAKIKRQRDYAEMIHNITEQLKDIYAINPKKDYSEIDSSFYEWEVITNFK